MIKCKVTSPCVKGYKIGDIILIKEQDIALFAFDVEVCNDAEMFTDDRPAAPNDVTTKDTAKAINNTQLYRAPSATAAARSSKRKR